MLNRAFPAALALILGACSDDLPTADKPSSQPTAIVAQNGDGQTQVVDHMLANRLVARVTDARGRRVRNASVWFAVVAGGGTILSAATMRTDAAGLANAIWRLGTSTAVEQAVRARVSQHRTSGGWLDRASDGTAPMRSAAGARERGPALFLDNRYRAIPIASLYSYTGRDASPGSSMSSSQADRGITRRQGLHSAPGPRARGGPRAL